MKIGIFGCTADPFTSAHYEIVNKVLNDKLVDKVIVIPTIVNYYRKDKTELFDLASREHIIRHWFEDRIDVILDFHEYELAVNTALYYDNPKDINNRRYFHMLNDIFKRYGKTHEYFTIIGGDSWNNLPKWYNWNELGKETKFIVILRDNGYIKDLAAEHDAYKAQPTHVLELDNAIASISATKIRKQLEDICKGMSTGPAGTPLNIYLDEIDNYKKNKKTYFDKETEYSTIMKIVEENISNFERLLAHTPIFDLIESPEVEAGFRPVQIKSSDWVSIIVEKDRKFLMVKQLRYGLKQEFEEFPCGMLEKDEDVITAGMRELEEETGYKVLDRRSVHYLGKFAANPAFMTNHMHYLHVNLDYALYEEVPTKFDEHEHLTSYWTPKDIAYENFMKSSGSSLMAGAYLQLLKNNIM